MKDKTITLVCVTSIKHDLSLFAIKKTLENVPVDSVLICSDEYFDLNQTYDFVKFKKPIDIGEYSEFIFKKLHRYIKTTHALIVQYDGFATKKENWDDNFLNYDFVGSISHTKHHQIQRLYEEYLKMEKTVDLNDWFKTSQWFSLGGGFSLRSKKLLEATSNDDVECNIPLKNKLGSVILPEDLATCVYNREKLKNKYDIKFAPIDVAMNFSCELYGAYSHALGFHGIRNIPFFLTEDECLSYIIKAKKMKEGFELTNRFNTELHFLSNNCKTVNYVKMVKYLENNYHLNEYWENQFNKV